ncbi:MAG: GNAT family N-acetyltransferase [Sphingobium sp.]|uniref:GNAT family N-acetyltransferase n=1 Tax=Sphingobium sp. TaxID=1912891 RepID=UPI0029ACD29C|nr:GNAT family N-acetyltransferase [Sphingobium sp.]MDX3910988.1 GNAT family N-acetyltransferase [Sphingobium sp.]
MIAPERLATDRLTLRPLLPTDAEALFPAFSDPELMTWWSSGPHATVEETRAYIAPDGGYGDEWLAWAITLSDKEAMGRVGAGMRRPGVWEIGYLLRRDLWGKGFAREAVGAVVDHLFADKAARRVFADVDPDNVLSIGLLRRLGFKEEGRLRGEWKTHLGVRDSLIFGLLRDEWNGAR